MKSRYRNLLRTMFYISPGWRTGRHLAKISKRRWWQGSIYLDLAELEDQGLVERRRMPSPIVEIVRHEFRITDAGIDAIEQTL